MSASVRLQGGGLSAEISTLGAELMSLRDAEGREFLWQGDPASWARRAPVLFPNVGRLAGSALRHAGKGYPHPGGHGFAPTSDFTLAAHDAASCVLVLVADAATRAMYPFEFRLSVRFQLADGALIQIAQVENTDTQRIAASVGFHPGFQWPLPTSADKAREDHVVLFEKAEPAPVRRIADGLMVPAREPSPVVGRRLALHDGLFVKDAIIFDRPASRALWFGVEGRPGISVAFPDCPHLGLWMRPPAHYFCIEPWQGHSDPEGFTGEIFDKPGMIHLARGEGFERRLIIRPNAQQI